MSSAWPKKLVFRKRAACLDVYYDDGDTVSIPYLKLRQNAPSADVQGHGNAPKPVQAPIAADIHVVKAEPVGRYAVRLHFSDGHANGLYMWDYLKTLS